jgi:hypothetical protein
VRQEKVANSGGESPSLICFGVKLRGGVLERKNRDAKA